MIQTTLYSCIRDSVHSVTAQSPRVTTGHRAIATFWKCCTVKLPKTHWVYVTGGYGYAHAHAFLSPIVSPWVTSHRFLGRVPGLKGAGEDFLRINAGKKTRIKARPYWRRTCSQMVMKVKLWWNYFYTWVSIVRAAAFTCDLIITLIIN